jgi:hypothetical protein
MCGLHSSKALNREPNNDSMGGRRMNDWELQWHIKSMEKSTKWIERELEAFNKLGLPANNINVRELKADLFCLRHRIELALKARQELRRQI